MLTHTIHHELGYYFAPSDRIEAPGHPSLEITLRAKPTKHHFDPDVVRVPIYLPDERIITQLRINHPWSGWKAAYQICLGRVFIRDRKYKRIEAFTLGGTLQIESTSEYTRCIIRSPAPIFDLLLPATLSTVMTEEFEVILAERRAQWSNEKSFEERLARAEPFQLYAACLKGLSDKFADYELVEQDPLKPLIHFLHSEFCVGPDGLISPLKVVPTLAELF